MLYFLSNLVYLSVLVTHHSSLIGWTWRSSLSWGSHELLKGIPSCQCSVSERYVLSLWLSGGDALWDVGFRCLAGGFSCCLWLNRHFFCSSAAVVSGCRYWLRHPIVIVDLPECAFPKGVVPLVSLVAIVLWVWSSCSIEIWQLELTFTQLPLILLIVHLRFFGMVDSFMVTSIELVHRLLMETMAKFCYRILGLVVRLQGSCSLYGGQQLFANKFTKWVAK